MLLVMVVVVVVVVLIVVICYFRLHFRQTEYEKAFPEPKYSVSN